MSAVTIVDYGRGNLFSLSRALEHLGSKAKVTSDPTMIEAAESLILPGVGAFGDGMDNLRSRALVEPLRRYAASGRPLLGICLGMQLLLESSDEFGHHEGLGLVPGRVTRFKDSAQRAWKVPHVGWSRINPAAEGGWSGSALASTPEGERMYFVHSYCAVPAKLEHRLAQTPYAGTSFCSALKAGQIQGFQFHPEKSGESGLRLLQEWLKDRSSSGSDEKRV